MKFVDKLLSLKPLITLISFIVSFWVIGIVLAFWYGIGWFLLLQTIRRFIFAIPQLAIPLVNFTVGVEAGEEMRNMVKRKGNRWITSQSAGLQFMMYLVATILVFTFANVSIKELLY